MPKLCDLTGKTFGFWKVLERVSAIKGMTYWKCQCRCGEVRNIESWGLKTGKTKSCGCYAKEATSARKKTHGKSVTRIYRTWSHMKERCNNPNIDRYPIYGGRGIKVCENWSSSFESFYEWAKKNGYQEDYSIDRINVNGNYCPENCRWIPMKMQSSNTRRNRYIKLNESTTVTLAELSRMTGVKRETLSVRLKKGWRIEDVMMSQKYQRIKI